MKINIIDNSIKTIFIFIFTVIFRLKLWSEIISIKTNIKSFFIFSKINSKLFYLDFIHASIYFITIIIVKESKDYHNLKKGKIVH